MKRVFVTGATGFIGREALPLLAKRGYDVHAVSHVAPRERSLGVHWHRLDLLDCAAVERHLARIRPSLLLHLAWNTRRSDHTRGAENLAWVGSSLTLVDRFRACGGKRAVFSGTYAEYGHRNSACDERDAVAPVSLYAVCKSALHQIVAAYAATTGLSYAWARIFTAYGPGDAPYRLIPYAVSSLVEGREAECGEGLVVRDFIFVKDVASALVRLLDCDIDGPVNVGTGRGHSVSDVLKEIAGQIGRPELLRIGKRTQRADEPEAVVCVPGRLWDAGWHPSTELAAGLRETIAWYSARKKKDR